MTRLFRAAIVAAIGSASCSLLLLAPSTVSAGGVSMDSKFTPLVQRSDIVAFGTCQTAESTWDDQHRFIITTVTFRPSRSFKGDAPTNLTIKLLGGQVGTEGMIASHSAGMNPGEDAVLFLQRSQFGTYYVITGGADGKLPVRADAVSGQPMIRGAVSLDDFGRWVSALMRAR